MSSGFDEINSCDVADSDRLEHQLEEAVMLQQDYESSASKLKMLEKQVKMLRQEKDDVHKVVPRQRESSWQLVFVVQ